MNDNLNEVISTWGVKPNGCYSLEITGIHFRGDEAVVLYRPHTPDEGDICPQVLPRPVASTYVAAQYKIRIAEDHADTAPLSLQLMSSECGPADGQRFAG